MPEERPLIAAVIYNRLKQGIPLGIDATSASRPTTGPSRSSSRELETTRRTTPARTPGLPPGPIGNPGLASIKAAAHPASTDYLYYVVKPGTSGEHDFSETDAEFQRDVAALQRASARRPGGKSPTDC